MIEIEVRLRQVLQTLRGIPKTERERAYIESLLIQLVSAEEMQRRVVEGYKSLDAFIRCLEGSQPIEVLTWLEANPLPANPMVLALTHLRGAGIPDDLITESIDLPGFQQEPTAAEAVAYTIGAFLASKYEDPGELLLTAAVKALQRSSGAIELGGGK